MGRDVSTHREGGTAISCVGYESSWHADIVQETFPTRRGKFIPLEYVLVMDAANDKYPFILKTGRPLEHWHGGTLTRYSSLNESYPEARLEMHPADVDTHVITNNMPVRVTARRGEIVLSATVTEKTTVGVVFIP